MEKVKIKIGDRDISVANVKYFKRGKYTQSINYINKGGKDQLTFFDDMTPAEFNRYYTTFKLRLENLGFGGLIRD